jgi:4-hydroxy-tetrahydrodipicolinate synthase
MTASLHLSGAMFEGSITALVTPFTDQGAVDHAALDQLVDFHLENGTAGLVIAGTTGESATLEREEAEAVLSQVVERVGGRIPVIAGTGGTSTARAVDQTRAAVERGADAVLVVTPYYNRPPQRGLVTHFRAIADASDVPLLLYNVPSRTSVDMLPETVEKLSAHPQIAGIKEAVADESRVRELIERCGPDFKVLSGDDHSCLRAMRNGARGVVSVAANVAPARMAALCEAATGGNWSRAETLDRELRPLFDATMLETNPIPVKWALFEMGLARPHVRLPLTELQQEHRAPLRECLAGLGLMT